MNEITKQRIIKLAWDYAEIDKLDEFVAIHTDLTGKPEVHLTVFGLLSIAAPQNWTITKRHGATYPYQAEITIGGIKYFAVFDYPELDCAIGLDARLSLLAHLNTE